MVGADPHVGPVAGGSSCSADEAAPHLPLWYQRRGVVPAHQHLRPPGRGVVDRARAANGSEHGDLCPGRRRLLGLGSGPQRGAEERPPVVEKGEAFDQLCRVLRALAPSRDEPLAPGALTKVSLDDARRHPTLRMPYARDVALVHASAGMRRIVALAYLLVWTWQEHLAACRHQGIEPAREILFLVDEIEAHLHPQWQRRIVPALLAVMEALTGDHDVAVQLVK